MKESRYKETLETLHIYDLPRNFFEAAAKETFKPNKENPNMEENLC